MSDEKQTRRRWGTRWFLAIALVAALIGIVLSEGLEDERSYAELSNGLGTSMSLTVRGRLVEEDDEFDPSETTPFHDMSQDELSRTELSLQVVHPRSGEAMTVYTGATDDDGFFEAPISLARTSLGPGRYTIRVVFQREVVGEAQVLVLGPSYGDVAIRSDVDLTYLDTDFSSGSAMVELLSQSASDRRTLPAMEVVYAALRRGSDPRRGLPRPITFISGSPTFFRRVLQAKMALDGVEQDGLVLKPFGEIVARNASGLSPSTIMSELEEQVGYKLTVLLELRLDLPAMTPEVLMGDDSEADVVVYALYHRFTSGQLDPDGLDAELARLGVAASWRERIRIMAPSVRENLRATAPVRAIYINHTARANESIRVSDWSEGGLVRYHDGAWPLILDLHEEGWVDSAAVRAVRTRLIELGQTPDQLEQAAEMGVRQGFLKRGGQHR